MTVSQTLACGISRLVPPQIVPHTTSFASRLLYFLITAAHLLFPTKSLRGISIGDLKNELLYEEVDKKDEKITLLIGNGSRYRRDVFRHFSLH